MACEGARAYHFLSPTSIVCHHETSKAGLVFLRRRIWTFALSPTDMDEISLARVSPQ
jgi:hypothetical protein